MSYIFINNNNNSFINCSRCTYRSERKIIYKMGKHKIKTHEGRYADIAVRQLRELRSELMKKNNPMFKEETRKKLSRLYTGRKISPET